MKTTGNTILITGGGSGIGRGLAEAFQALGNRVVISGRRQAKLDQTVAANPGMKSLTVDMADADSIRAFAAQVTQEFPGLNVLINMAGVMVNENLLEQKDPLSDAETTIATNLLGPLRLTAALLPHLLTQPHATIMNVSSGLAFVPLAMTPTYSATKAAIHSYTQSLRYQLRDTRVEVLELIPPYVQTELMGERQASDPNAMPLGEYVTEVMGIIGTEPTPPEICVERVKSRRFAAAQGQAHYDQLFQSMNDAMMAARAAEFPQ
jgi:uncharacterized oxidoreductase